TIDGTAKFLVFVSYFDGLRRPTGSPGNYACNQQNTAATVLACDLAMLRQKGVDGIRVLPNWSAPRLMNMDGTLNNNVLQALQTLVNTAAAYHLVVDISFNGDIPF